MKFSKTVLLTTLLGACTTPAKEPLPTPPAVVPPSAAASAAPPEAPSAPPAPSASAEPPKVSAAYAGCGQPIAPERLWEETTEAEVLDAISEAKACAAEHGRRLLLEFVAPWCDDCQEMAKLEAAPAVEETLRERFERVRINIGKWDRHEALRESFGVRALATYIVLDPKTSKQLAKTTLEPITRPGKKLTSDDWRRWLAKH